MAERTRRIKGVRQLDEVIALHDSFSIQDANSVNTHTPENEAEG